MHFSSALDVFFPSLAEEGFFPAASDLEAVLVFIFLSCFYGTYDIITSKKSILELTATYSYKNK